MKQVEHKQQDGRLNPKSSLITLKSKWITTRIKGRDFQTGKKARLNHMLSTRDVTINIKSPIH